MKICKITARPGSQCFLSTYQRVTGQIITGHSPCPVYTVQNTLVKVGSKDFNTKSHLASLIFVEFAEELTQKSQYSFHWRHGHRKVLLSSR